jgi:Lipoprotein LpqB beta-propeller domain
MATFVAFFEAFALLTAAGCGLPLGSTWEEVDIPPTLSRPTADPGLGPGARPLSFGPGDKGSPRINPSGDQVAFVLDGHVVEKSLYARDFRGRTENLFGALGAEWLPDGSLVVLSPEGETEAGDAKTTPKSLFVAPPDNLSNVRELAVKIEAAGAVPGGQAVVAAEATSPTPESPDEPPASNLVLLWGSEEPAKAYLEGRIEGHVTGLAVSPDESQAILAVRNEGQDEDRFELQVYPFSEGQPRRVAYVPEGMEILGAPQWTSRGIYFVAGKAERSTEAAPDEDPALYALYRVPEGSEVPEMARSVGEDFAAANISVSPDGGRLAVVGRRSPGSPTNLYVLNLASNTLEAVTTNENMEIKTNPRDLAWSPDGGSVIVVARGILSGPKMFDVPAEALSSAFYNLYEVEVTPSSNGGF